MILTQQLITSNGKNLTRSAFRYLGKETLYKDFLAAVSRLSYLYQHEIGQGVRMAFYARSCPALIYTFFAMTNTRSLSIFINPESPPDEVIKWLRESKATHIAVSSDLLSQAREILQSDRLNLPIIEMEKKHGGEYDTSYTPPPEQTPQETDAILLVRSAGTTGKNKFVIFTHKQLIHGSNALKGHYHLLGTDRIHTSSAWYHPFIFTHGFLFPLMAGATLVMDHGLQAVEYLDYLVESRVTRLVGFPTYFLKLLVVCKNEKRVLPGIKSITVGMGYLSADLKKAFDLLKIPVSHVYGQVENLWTIAMQDAKEPGSLPEGYVRGFVGKGLPGLKYKVVDDNGDEIETKTKRIGQLAFSGPTIMQGYMDREKEQKQVMRGTWLYTGDLVRLDGEGETLTLTYMGRKEDVALNNSGEPVPFYQIDSAIRSNPGVQDGAAFTVKNSKGRPVVVCAVVRKAGAALNEKQLLDFCAGSLAGDLVPRFVAFTDTIPRDVGNNVNCSKLRAQFSGIAG